MAMGDSCPVMVRKTACGPTTPPKYTSQSDCGERAVDEGAVYDEIYLVEPVAKHRDPDRGREAEEHPSK